MLTIVTIRLGNVGKPVILITRGVTKIILRLHEFLLRPGYGKDVLVD